MITRHQIVCGGAVETLAELPVGAAHMLCTSPPYWNLRDYSHPDQLGSEPLHDCLAWAKQEPPCGGCFVCNLRAVFAAASRVLRDDGLLFLNLGDGYARQAGDDSKKDPNGIATGYANVVAAGAGKKGNNVPPAGLKATDLVGAPWRVALALQADGWYLRNEIIWKANKMPESMNSRFTRNHEHIFMLAKSAAYFFDAIAVAEPSQHSGKIVKLGEKSGSRRSADSIGCARSGNALLDAYTVLAMRNKRTVWDISLEPSNYDFCLHCDTLFEGTDRSRIQIVESNDKLLYICPVCRSTDHWVEHYAAFPSALPKICIQAGTSAYGCCPQCLTPWTRIVEKTTVKDPSAKGSRFDKGKTGDRDGGDRTQKGDRYLNQAIGWEPGCACGSDTTVPCTVLDCFGGSGTTAIAAQELGRHSISIDLNPHYCSLMKKRIHSVTPGLSLA